MPALTWGSKEPPSFDPVRTDEAKLADATEEALDFLICSKCKKPFH